MLNVIIAKTKRNAADRRLYEYVETMKMNRLRGREFLGYGVSKELMNPSKWIYWLL